MLWCLICCEASISRTQQSPGWPSGPAVSDTSSPSCPAASPDGGGPTRRRAHRSSSPPPTTHSGQRGGENGGLSYLCHPHLHLHLHLQPLLLLLLHLWPCSRDEDSPTSLPSLIFFVLPWTDKLTFEVLGKENPAARPILLPPEVAPPEGPVIGQLLRGSS